MSNILNLNTPRVDIGLVTDTFTIPSTGQYNLTAQITEIPPSGLSVVVNQNGSPIYTSVALPPTQSSLQFKVPINGVLNDAITFVLSSSNSNDLLLNSVKTNVSLGQGF
jgi:hypothetical protein